MILIKLYLFWFIGLVLMGCASSQTRVIENKKIVESYYRAYNKGDIESQILLMGPEFVYHSNSDKKELGIDAYRKYTLDLNREVKEDVYQILYIVGQDPSHVVAQSRVRGEYLLSPLNNKPTYEMPLAEIFEIRNGKIIKLSTYYNEASWEKQVKLNIKPQGDSKMENEFYKKIKVAKRAEVISLAKTEIEKQLGKIEFTDFPKITAQKLKNDFQVIFRSQFDGNLGDKKTSQIRLYSSENKTRIEPLKIDDLLKHTPDMRKVAQLFSSTDSISSLGDSGDHYTVSVSHEGGGAEGYKIDKKTFKKDMTWHEHPESHGQGVTVKLSGFEDEETWTDIE